ncbi:MAG: DUF4160 domain-containing protein [Dehalococcoidia bacterium]|nr:DUF4160 domain-containing protein [Dehalococcoidia bacterium]
MYRYFSDHSPPHFHVIYGQYEAVFQIEPVEVLQGRFPTRALSLVREWAAIYREELRGNRKKAQEAQPLQRIPPVQ